MFFCKHHHSLQPEHGECSLCHDDAALANLQAWKADAPTKRSLEIFWHEFKTSPIGVELVDRVKDGEARHYYAEGATLAAAIRAALAKAKGDK